MNNDNSAVQGAGAIVELSLSDVPALAMQGLFGEPTVLTLENNSSLPDAYNFQDYFVIVRSGWAALKCDEKYFCVLPPGEVFFQPAWPTDAAQAHQATVLFAVTPVELILVDRIAFLAVTEPNLMFAMYSLLFKRMLFLMKTLAHLGRERGKERLAYFLRNVGIPLADGTRRLPQLHESVIAECLGLESKDILEQREALICGEQLFSKGGEDYLSAEVDAMAVAAGYRPD